MFMGEWVRRIQSTLHLAVLDVTAHAIDVELQSNSENLFSGSSV
jgi:hypothetical protein